MNTVSYTYDSNGNMISETEGIETTLYTYDVWGNLVAAGDTTYGYDYAGLRISKNSDQFYNINGVVAIEKVGETVYTSLLGAERIRRNDTLYLYDAHGNVVNLINSSGIEKVYDYDAYGNQLSIETGDENPFRYCGEYYDEETGFIYLRARYYSPETGRFISQDPAKDGINWYTYCADNPVAFVDRNGMWLETAWDIFSLGMSIVDVCRNPTDPLAWAGLAGDAVDVLVPCFGGIGETIKGARTVGAVAGKVDDVVDTFKTADKIKKAEDITDKVVDSYNNMKKLVKKFGIKGKEVHHLIEKRFAKILGTGKNDIFSIILDKDTHNKITQAFRKKIPYATKRTKKMLDDITPNKIWKTVVEVYNEQGMKKYIPLLKKYLEENATNVSKITDWKGY